jgi:Holliday junction resolvase
VSDPRGGNEKNATERVADALANEGFKVFINPPERAIPFDLAGYHPDILATRENERLIVEVKRSEKGTSVDQYVEVARLVRDHPGWRFLLVPSDTVEEEGVIERKGLPDWTTLVEQSRVAGRLISNQLYAASFLASWAGVEGTLRRVAQDEAIPVEVFSVRPLIKHLYSFGILSILQLRELEALEPVRNEVAHGFVVREIAGPALRLYQLFVQLLELRSRSGPMIEGQP